MNPDPMKPTSMNPNPNPNPTPNPDPNPMPTPDPTPTPDPNPTPNPNPTPSPTTVPAGNVSGSWCGMVTVEGSVTIPSAQTLEVCAGASVQFASNAALTIAGTLQVNGTADQRVAFTAANRWNGIRVGTGGALHAVGLDVSKASLCLEGQAGSSIDLSSSTLVECGQSFRIANGATFDKTQITGGVTASITGGTLAMTDSVIDLQYPTGNGPDCTDWAGGGATLDHVRFTGCHCPLHFNSTNLPIRITNSIFDHGSVPVMIAGSMDAIFTSNDFRSSGPQFLDIGGGIHADIAGNFWGDQNATTGQAPGVSTADISQFSGMGSYVTTPITGAGPRM
jgi:hypothetical protein